MSEFTVDSLVIPAEGSLDTITVFWQNYELGRGAVTLTCWGSAWTCYFGGMGERTIQQFFSSIDVGYMVNKLGYTKWLKSSKTHDAYIGRIVVAVKNAMAPNVA